MTSDIQDFPPFLPLNVFGSRLGPFYRPSGPCRKNCELFIFSPPGNRDIWAIQQMKKILASTIFYILLLIPAVIVFRNFFLSGPLAWGDAPHYYPEEASELFSVPLAWTNRGEVFGEPNLFLWLWPLMTLYGALSKLAGLGNDLIIRILFFFPSVILSFIGPALLTRYLKLPKVVSFFASLIYTFNTYFLLLIDGGQVGVALSYGLFPFALLFLKKLIDKADIKNFFLALIVVLLGSIADPRVMLISFLTLIIWTLVEAASQKKFAYLKNLIYLAPLGIAWLGANSFWIYPLLKNSIEAQSLGVTELRLVSLINPLFLFSPHWPTNVFGKIFPPQFYFIVIPLLIFSGLFKKSRQGLIFAFVFLAFSFLAKGSTPPLGSVYDWLIRLPFGSAFRDSSKFFVPVVLFGGILIGQSLSFIKNRWGLILAYLFLLFLVHPAFSGQLNFVLSNRTHSRDMQIIYENLRNEAGQDFFRTAWFPEREPMVFETEESPAGDAKELANFRPFAGINAGEDVFNFLNNEDFVQWFRVLGIKYLILSDDPRRPEKTAKEKEGWEEIVSLIENNKNLQRVNWGTQIPIYKVSDTYPRFFATKRLIAIVGPQIPLKNSPPPPAVYFEDGRLIPKELEAVDADSLMVVFNQKDKVDLMMSFLQGRFVSPYESSKSQWAIYYSEELLKYKYELLIRGVDFSDFDYGRGIAFSTNKEEELEFNFEVPQEGEYLFAARVMDPKEQITLKWEISQPMSLSKGNHKRIVKNTKGFEILNVVALIPKKEWNEAQELTENFLNRFSTLDSKNLDKLVEEDFQQVSSGKIGSSKYKFSIPEGYNWLIFTDSYHRLWKAEIDSQNFDSYPVYSMVNGFYTHGGKDIEIEFKGQENLKKGIAVSAFSILGITLGFLFFIYYKRLR